MPRLVSGNGGAGGGISSLRAQQITATVPSGQTGTIGNVMSNSLVAALLGPVSYAKTGGNANLLLNASTGAYSNTAALGSGVNQAMTGTATGADGFVVPLSFSLTGQVVAQPVPVNSVLPAITGTAQVGQVLTCSQGTWTNSPTGYAYQWRWNDTGAVIAGATSASYTAVAGDVGHPLACAVVASNAGGNSAAAVSGATATVAAAAQQFSSLLASTPTGINLGTRNGVQVGPNTGLYATGPTLTNVFGNGTATAGALAIWVRFKPGEQVSTAQAMASNSLIPILGTNGSSGGGGIALIYYPLSFASNQDRFVWSVKDNSGATINVISGLVCAQASGLIDASGVFSALLVLRGDAAGNYTLTMIGADGTTVVGATTTLSTFKGRGSVIGAPNIGHLNASGVAPALGLGNYLPGSFAYFIQLDGVAGTDAEWLSVAQGAVPSAVWPSNLAAHYGLTSPTDLAKKAGTRGYGAFTLGTTGSGGGTHGTVGIGKMTRNAAGTRGLGYAPLYLGYVHAVDSEAWKGAADNLAAKRALKATVSRDVFVMGAASHVRARAVRKSDGLVLTDWTRVTAAPGTGRVPILLPNVPIWQADQTGRCSEIVYDLQLEDDQSFTAQIYEADRVGAVVEIQGQSQQDYFFRGEAGKEPNDIVPNADSAVSFMIYRLNVETNQKLLPVDGGYLRMQGLVSSGMAAAALYWDSLNSGIAIELVHSAIGGHPTYRWIMNSTKNTSDQACLPYWGDGVTPHSGVVTSIRLAKRRRVTASCMSWHTADRTGYDGYSSPGVPFVPGDFPTMYAASGNVYSAELPWTDRINEMYGGIPKSTAGATERSRRSNYVGTGATPSLAVFKSWIIGIPVSRGTINIAAANDSTAALWTAQRKQQFDYFENGVGRDPSVMTSFGGFQYNLMLDSQSSPHQSQVNHQGNDAYGLLEIQAIASALKVSTHEPRVFITSVTGVGTTRLTVTVPLKNGGALGPATAGQPLLGFAVQNGSAGTLVYGDDASNGFTTTVLDDGSTPGIAKLALDKAQAGNWLTGTLVHYMNGTPWSRVNTGGDTANFGGFIVESRADTVPAGVSGVVLGVPLGQTINPIAASA
jgi:hypothetical protein